MTSTDQLIRLHAAEHRMENEVHALEARVEALGDDIEVAESSIEAAWRREHWGRDPDRPFRWRAAGRRPRRRVSRRG